MKTISEIGELNLIKRIQKKVRNGTSVVCGIGDDCAVLKKDKTTYHLFATDQTIEGVHFNRRKVKPEAVGYKALARNVSDVAAMGGLPTCAVIACALPNRTPLSYIDALYTGIMKCARQFNIAVVGGDFSLANKIMITISILGEVGKKHLILRSGARAGDSLYVTGVLGGSIVKKHVCFTPRIKEAQFLSKYFTVNAMIDISDGLLQDLGHILAASNVGCVIGEKSIPLSCDAKRIATKRKTALEHALTDGEDFELLFTVPQKEGARLEKKWKQQFRTRLTRIGTIIKKEQIHREHKKAGTKLYENKGFMHF